MGLDEFKVIQSLLFGVGTWVLPLRVLEDVWKINSNVGGEFWIKSIAIIIFRLKFFSVLATLNKILEN